MQKILMVLVAAANIQVATAYKSDSPPMRRSEIIGACEDAFNNNPGRNIDGVSPEEAEAEIARRGCKNTHKPAQYETCKRNGGDGALSQVAFEVAQRQMAEQLCRKTLEKKPINFLNFDLCLSLHDVRDARYLDRGQLSQVLACFARSAEKFKGFGSQVEAQPELPEENQNPGSASGNAL